MEDKNGFGYKINDRDIDLLCLLTGHWNCLLPTKWSQIKTVDSDVCGLLSYTTCFWQEILLKSRYALLHNLFKGIAGVFYVWLYGALTVCLVEAFAQSPFF